MTSPARRRLLPGLPWAAPALLLAALALPAPAGAADGAAPPRPVVCTFSGLVDGTREALTHGSPALRRYARERLKEAALTLSAATLRDAVEREHDPVVLEALTAALATKAGFTEDASLVQPALTRAVRDADPTTRAAALRGLRGTASVELMERNGATGTYAQLLRDPSPEVREAAVGNLVQESAEVYSGHDRRVSETAVEAALAASDPRAAAALLRQVSMEQVGPSAVERLSGQLRAESAEVRAAAATALGGVPGASARNTRETLVARYREESDPTVRRSLLEALARLGMSGAVPTLTSLRGVDPALAPEVDAWVRALGTGLQEWHLVLREKQRLQR